MFIPPLWVPWWVILLIPRLVIVLRWPRVRSRGTDSGQKERKSNVEEDEEQ